MAAQFRHSRSSAPCSRSSPASWLPVSRIAVRSSHSPRSVSSASRSATCGLPCIGTSRPCSASSTNGSGRRLTAVALQTIASHWYGLITGWADPIDNGSGHRQSRHAGVAANDCGRGGPRAMADTGRRDGARLGWIGTGRMGTEMARRLLEAGCDLAVYNRTAAKAGPLTALGATPADTIAALAGRDIVFMTVGTSDDMIEAARSLMHGPDVPKVLVDCSTVSAEASARIRAEISVRGTALLAAPVMGNPRGVRAGRMTAAVSGPREAFDRALPYLNILGQGVTYVGDGEAARMVKLCHNLFLGVVAQTLAEITVLAEKSGISRHAFLECINASVMGSSFTKYKSPAYVN